MNRLDHTSHLRRRLLPPAVAALALCAGLVGCAVPTSSPTGAPADGPATGHEGAPEGGATPGGVATESGPQSGSVGSEEIPARSEELLDTVMVTPPEIPAGYEEGTRAAMPALDGPVEIDPDPTDSLGACEQYVTDKRFPGGSSASAGVSWVAQSLGGHTTGMATVLLETEGLTNPGSAAHDQYTRFRDRLLACGDVPLKDLPDSAARGSATPTEEFTVLHDERPDRAAVEAGEATAFVCHAATELFDYSTSSSTQIPGHNGGCVGTSGTLIVTVLQFTTMDDESVPPQELRDGLDTDIVDVFTTQAQKAGFELP
ncbi:hypothetical protein [Brevibacterium litoralis]|uniref:hypothetical protein n=1 Tax=Brevibacterium litoralis TaxID=3138935 RepID=UPI0032EDAB5A